MKSNMSSNNLETYAEGHEGAAIERKFIQKWTIHGLECEKVTSEKFLPNTKFDFGTADAKFWGKFHIEGDSCKNRLLVLELENDSLDNWQVWIDLRLGNKESTDRYSMALSKNSNKGLWQLFGSLHDECLFTKHQRNKAFTITCVITCIIPKAQQLSSSTAAAKINWNASFIVADYKPRPQILILTVSRKGLEPEMERSNQITLTSSDMQVFQSLLRYHYADRGIKIKLLLVPVSDSNTELMFKETRTMKGKLLQMAHKMPKFKQQIIDCIEKSTAAVMNTYRWNKPKEFK